MIASCVGHLSTTETPNKVQDSKAARLHVGFKAAQAPDKRLVTRVTGDKSTGSVWGMPFTCENVYINVFPTFNETPLPRSESLCRGLPRGK